MRHFLKLCFYFLLGAVSTTVVLVSISYLIFAASFKNKVYPGVQIPNIQVDPNLKINIWGPNASISATAKEINLHPDIDLMSKRAFSIGRQTKNPYYNFLQIMAAWQGKIALPPEVTFDQDILSKKIDAIAPKIERSPVDAVFKFTAEAGPDKKGRVEAFIPSQNGLVIDRNKIYQELIYKVKNSRNSPIPIYTKVVVPNIQTSTADQMGIKDLLGRGESYFYDSIPGRVYNINLGTNKINGSIIAPNEIFSFDQAIGTVSAVFGFQKAYAIIKGKTTLDDGGGVCQVSTTLYRAVLNAGLPVIARTTHTYRVGFYEEGGFKPGLDATVYPPDPDFKFKNDTNGYILIQTIFDVDHAKLTFELFGANDGRQTTIQGPYILSTTPPPEPIYEDDPISPIGQIRQVDTAHFGAKVYFNRIVTRDQQTIINETVWSNYVPWPARYLKGTKT